MSLSTPPDARRVRRRWLACCLWLPMLPVLAATLHAQVELLPLEHPATAALVRLHEHGAIPDFPREHLPISRELAADLLAAAVANERLPASLRDQAAYYLIELGADLSPDSRQVIIPIAETDDLIYDDILASRPIVGLQVQDSAGSSRLVAEPLLDADLRIEPESGATSLILQGGAQLRGTLVDRIGFAARVTNGTVLGDSGVAAHDPKISRAGAFGIAAFGRDIDFAFGHLRVDYDVAALEIAREPVQLGGGLSRSLLLGSALPSAFDYLRFSARIRGFTFTHVHGSLLPDIGKEVRGAGVHIPQRYIATHLLSVGPFAGIRLSLGESIIYSGRPFEIGYLNPFVFLRSQEHTYRDRDNANMYASVRVNPAAGIFLEGEFILDDLRFSRMGEGFWANKTGWRLLAQTRGVPLGPVDIGLSYTRLEPYIFSHFSDTNAYTHDSAPLAAGGLLPNSYLAELTIDWHPLPNLSLRGTFGTGEHGANVIVADTLARNVGGDIHQTRRMGIDSDTVAFLDGAIERLGGVRLDVDYEPLRNLYLRLTAFEEMLGDNRRRELRLGIRFGAR